MPEVLLKASFCVLMGGVVDP